MAAIWAGTDAGKTHHHCVAIDESGRRLLSRRVANDEPELLELLADVLALGDEVTWDIDLADGGAALAIAILLNHDQPVLYLSGRAIHRASELTLLAADFPAGTAVSVPIGRDGGLGAVASRVQDTGSGPHPRQQGPHAHHVITDPSGRFALVADFGADRVFVYRFDRATRALSAGPGTYATAPGSGPRRLAFHPSGRTVYLLNELTADIQALHWNHEDGVLTHLQSLATDAPGHTGTTSAAELAVSRDGRFLYTSNRGENTLVVFSADRRTGLLALVQRIPCAGLIPWSFSLHPGGRWLFVANQASDTVNLFSVDPWSGQLTDTGASVPVPKPDCITFSRR